MADLLIAATEGQAWFGPDEVAAAIMRQWPSADVVAVDGPELADLAQLMSTQATISDGQQGAVVEFHTSAKAIDIEGDDDLAAEFLALLTRTVPIPEDTIVVMNWADDLVTLRPNMTSDDVRALVEAGGAGLWFNDLRLYSPGDPVRSHDLAESDGVFEDLLLFWEDDPEFRPADLPDDARLIAWANTGHGETLFWRVDAGNSSGVYPIYVEDGDGARWERFDPSTTDLLFGILHGTVSSQLFSDLFMDTEQVFRPYTQQP